MKNGFLLLSIVLISLPCGQRNNSRVNISIEKDSERPNYLDYVLYPCAFIDIDYYGLIPLLDSPDGDTLLLVQNDSITENYHYVALIDQASTFFKVILLDSFWEKEGEGWLSNEHIQIFDRMYSSDDPLILYSKPDINSPPVYVVDTYSFYSLQVIGFSDKWLKIRFFSEKKDVIGWLSPEMQCCNIFTTCS